MARRKLHLQLPGLASSLCGMYHRPMSEIDTDRNLTMDPTDVDCKHCLLAYRYNKKWYEHINQTEQIKRIVRRLINEDEKWFRSIVRDEIAQMMIEENKRVLERHMSESVWFRGSE